MSGGSTPARDPKFDPIAQALQEALAALTATHPICETMPGGGYVCSGCPAEEGDHCVIQEIRDRLIPLVHREGS